MLNSILETGDKNGTYPTSMLRYIKHNIHIHDEIEEIEASMEKIKNKITKTENKVKIQTAHTNLRKSIKAIPRLSPESKAVYSKELPANNTLQNTEAPIDERVIYTGTYGHVTQLRRHANRQQNNFGRSRAHTLSGIKTTQRNKRCKTNAKAPFHHRCDRTKRRYRD